MIFVYCSCNKSNVRNCYEYLKILINSFTNQKPSLLIKLRTCKVLLPTYTPINFAIAFELGLKGTSCNPATRRAGLENGVGPSGG